MRHSGVPLLNVCCSAGILKAGYLNVKTLLSICKGTALLNVRSSRRNTSMRCLGVPLLKVCCSTGESAVFCIGTQHSLYSVTVLHQYTALSVLCDE